MDCNCETIDVQRAREFARLHHPRPRHESREKLSLTGINVQQQQQAGSQQRRRACLCSFCSASCQALSIGQCVVIVTVDGRSLENMSVPYIFV